MGIKISQKFTLISCIVICVFCATLSSLMMLNGFNTGVTHEAVESLRYNHLSNKYTKDNYIQMISRLCDLNNESIDKIACTFDYYKRLYNGKIQNGSFNSVEYSLTNSTNCANSVIFYCAVFKNMGLKCTSKLTKRHVFAVVELEKMGKYCIIDQNKIWCN